MLPEHQHIIFFDGVCNLCNSSVQRIIRNDKKNIFHFASLQSDFTKQFFTNKQLVAVSNTILYWNGEKIYARSSAVLHIASHLNFPYPLLTIFFIVPNFLRNVVYNFIARNRYKWFGKKDSCMIPDANLKQKFLDQI